LQSSENGLCQGLPEHQMTSVLARRRILGDRDPNRRFGRRAARPQREQVLQATNDVGVLLSMLAPEDEPEA
jgi:hypothetical protein